MEKIPILTQLVHTFRGHHNLGDREGKVTMCRHDEQSKSMREGEGACMHEVATYAHERPLLEELKREAEGNN